MRVLLALFSCLVVAACGCSPSDAGAPPGGGNPADKYDGPELKAMIETSESHPPQYTLKVDVNCPTGGYTFKMSEFDSKSTPREVKFILTSPATEELVIQVFENHTERIDLGTDRSPVRVCVSQRQRRNPDADKQPFKLAASVTPH